MDQIEVSYLDKPFKIKDMPLDKVYVVDNYLETSLHHWIENYLDTANMWSKSNKVRGQSKTGLPHHELWGAAFFVGQREDGSLIRGDCTNFGFKWKRFQYMGTNSQTFGKHGTTHADCDPNDEWNLSFLYYYNTFWNPAWGGDLRLYNSMQFGIDGREEHVEENCIGSIEFVPNRLLIFDGRIPHGADAPSERARYADRCSIVLRGDEIELVDSEEFYNANDRLYNF